MIGRLHHGYHSFSIPFSNSTSAADSDSLMEGCYAGVPASLQIPSNLGRTVFSAFGDFKGGR